MHTAILAGAAYVIATFIASALIVRVAPRAHSSRHIRKNLTLFVVLPILLLADILATIELLCRACNRTARAVFEFLSGRSLHSSENDDYDCFGYSHHRKSRRRSDRRGSARATGKVNVANS